MNIADEFLASFAVAPQTEAQAAGQAAAQAGAEVARAQAAQARAQAAQAREQAQQVRDQAQQIRDQAQQFKENLRLQIQSEIDAARAVQQGVPVPPIPPLPPLPETFSGQRVRNDFGDVPPGAVEMASILGMTLVFCVVGFPIARALARWLDRRGTPVPTSPELNNRLQAIEQAVESVAVEVERISEGQRFTTRVLSERQTDHAAEYLVRERDVMQVGLPPDSGPGAPVNARRS